MKIAVYAIARDEAAHVERFIASCQDADLILIADTGSTDDTVQIARDLGAMVHSLSISPWRFDDARNASLALVPGDIDVCVCLDLDEELQPGWRAEVERCWTDGVTRLRYLYDWGSGVRYHGEKIHARRGYRWHHPCHERVVADRIEDVLAWTDALLIRHFPDQTKSRGQYLDLLALSVREDPRCPRNAFYYARELAFAGQHAEAIQRCQAYLDMPAANWPEERSYAMRIIAQCWAARNLPTSALIWARRAAAEAPRLREPWCAVALHAHNESRWEECYGAAREALAITSQPPLYMNEAAAYGSHPHDMAALAAWHLGREEEALCYAEAALALAPDDARLLANVEAMRPRL